MKITQEQLISNLKDSLADTVAIVSSKENGLEIYFPGGQKFEITVKEA